MATDQSWLLDESQVECVFTDDPAQDGRRFSGVQIHLAYDGAPHPPSVPDKATWGVGSKMQTPQPQGDTLTYFNHINRHKEVREVKFGPQ